MSNSESGNVIFLVITSGGSGGNQAHTYCIIHYTTLQCSDYNTSLIHYTLHMNMQWSVACQCYGPSYRLPCPLVRSDRIFVVWPQFMDVA